MRNKAFSTLLVKPMGAMGRLAQDLKGSEKKLSDESRSLNAQLGIRTQRSRGWLQDFHSRADGIQTTVDWKPSVMLHLCSVPIPLILLALTHHLTRTVQLP